MIESNVGDDVVFRMSCGLGGVWVWERFMGYGVWWYGVWEWGMGYYDSIYGVGMKVFGWSRSTN